MIAVGVYPTRELEKRTQLFSALALAFPLRFEPLDSTSGRGLGAVISFNEVGSPIDGGGKRFVVDETVRRAGRATIRFGDRPPLDARLRRRRLVDATVAPSAIAPREGDTVLATADGQPVWVNRGGTTDVVAYAPGELADGALLRDRLDAGRFVELLPLVHFLREVCAPAGWQPPAPRAVFVLDDPNLHWRSYGYLSYPELIRHAHTCSYHMSMAMVPADGWYAHAGTVRLFSQNEDVVSLCVHGNDHRWHELGRLESKDEARRVVAQAVRRIAAFQRRTGLTVSPVMAPPHESCSEHSMAVLLELGFEAATVTRPYPWMPFGSSESPYATPVSNHVLSGWGIAELMPDGLPVSVRREFSAYDDIVLRSFLDQPLILYGHVSDLAVGLDQLERAAMAVNGVPDVRWGSLADICRTNFEQRRDGKALELRSFARVIRVRVDPDIDEIRLQPPARVRGFDSGLSVRLDPSAHDSVSIEKDTVVLPAERGSTTTIEIRWRPEHEIAPETVPSPAFSGRALTRRVLSEGRDRAAPLLRGSRTMSRETATVMADS